jgi:hypothetical protein
LLPEIFAAVIFPVKESVVPVAFVNNKLPKYEFPETDKLVVDALPRVALPVTFKIPPKLTSPLAVRAVLETALKEESPEAEIVFKTEAPETVSAVEDAEPRDVSPVTLSVVPIATAPVVFTVAAFTKPLAVIFVLETFAKEEAPVVVIEPKFAAPVVWNVPTTCKVEEALAEVPIAKEFKTLSQFNKAFEFNPLEPFEN